MYDFRYYTDLVLESLCHFYGTANIRSEATLSWGGENSSSIPEVET